MRLRDSNHLWVAKTSQTGKFQLRNGCVPCQGAWEQIPPSCFRLDPAQTLGFSRSLGEAAADPCSQDGVSPALSWLHLLDPCWESQGSWHCTRQGRAAQGKARPNFGKNTHFPCLPHLPSRAPSAALRAVPGQVQTPRYPWKIQTRAQNSHKHPKNHSQT